MMSISLTVQSIRTAAQQIRDFRNEYVNQSEKVDSLFEFAALIAIVERLRTATGQPAIVRRQGCNRFARKPGDISNFNYVAVGQFEVYFGVEFRGRSGALHAPDVVVAVRDAVDGQLHVLIVIECKHYSGDAVPRGLTNAFAGVLHDLGRPEVQTLGSRLRVGVRYVDCKLITDPTVATVLQAMPEAGWSYLETTCGGVPPEHHLIGKWHGFHVTCAGASNRLV